MRKPSDRAELWRRWRERLTGVRPRAWAFDQVECGRYRGKRRGQWVAVQIDIEQEIDPDTGELLAPESYVAFVNGERFDDFERVVTIWERCGAYPIDDDQFRRLSNLPRVENLGSVIVT